MVDSIENNRGFCHEAGKGNVDAAGASLLLQLVLR